MTNSTEETTTTTIDPITVYGHPFCGMVPPTLAMLKSAGADFEYIDIYQDEAARAYVAEVNRGNLSVPTLRFPDGSILTEPSAGQLRTHLRQRGHQVPLTSWLAGNLHLLIMLAIVVYALLRFLEMI